MRGHPNRPGPNDRGAENIKAIERANESARTLHIVLQRRGGHLVLNADTGNWTDGLRLEDEIRHPHQKRSLRSPLL